MKTMLIPLNRTGVDNPDFPEQNVAVNKRQKYKKTKMED